MSVPAARPRTVTTSNPRRDMKTGRSFLLGGAILLTVPGCETTTAPASDHPATLSHNPNHGGNGGPGGGPGGGDFQPVTVTFVDALGDGVTSDGRGPYADDTCGVNAEIDQAKRGGQMTMDPDNKRIKNNQFTQCNGTDPRYVQIDFVDAVGGVGTPQTVPTTGIFQVWELHLIDPGKSGTVNARINTGPCGVLRWNGADGSDQVSATRTGDGSTWALTVSATDVGFCRDDNTRWYIPWSATISIN